MTAAPMAPPEVPTAALLDGRRHPLLVFGTYKVGVVPALSATGASVARSAREVIPDALAVGYRAFDCAAFYENEADVGAALEASGVPREELYLISKVWTRQIYDGPEAVKRQVEKTLKDLRTTYLDACLIHWPVPGKHVAAYGALEELCRAGLIRTLGVSNYTIEDCLELAAAATIPPAINQLEISPWLYRRRTVEFFASRGVLLQSYRTLRQGKSLSDPTLAAIAARHGRTPAQVVGRWCVQRGFVFMPKSQRRERMEDNADVFSFELAEGEMESLDGLTAGEAVRAFRAAYDVGVVRDTPLQGVLDVSGRIVTED
ncbi:NADP-dependent oxidoreductase domain-containing protein [Hyaloraphidium curvatum]|nr:NADP-dependent oxidoreductase domain-containing protein [Hyaloraphidium curvatum]